MHVTGLILSILMLVSAAAAPALAVQDQDAAGATPADSNRGRLDAIRDDLVSLEFERALAALDALLGRPWLSPDERGEALVLRSQANVSFGDLDAAENDYRKILRWQPGWQPAASLTPQKAMARFEEVRGEVVGRALVEVDPPEAELLIDGQAVLLDADGRVFLLGGGHEFVARLEGFDPAAITREIAAGAEATVRLSLVPNARTVVLETEPDGVEVFVDGVSMGQTRREAGGRNLPATLTLANLPLGDHRFELVKPCFRTERFDEFLSVDLLDRSPRRINVVRMTPAMSTIVLEGGPPGADVTIDGAAVGRLPTDPHGVCPGLRTVEVRFAGRILWSRRLNMAEASQQVVPVISTAQRRASRYR